MHYYTDSRTWQSMCEHVGLNPAEWEVVPTGDLGTSDCTIYVRPKTTTGHVPAPESWPYTCRMCDLTYANPLPDHGCCPNHTRIDRVLAGHEPDPYASNACSEDMVVNSSISAAETGWEREQLDRNAAFNRAIDRPTPHYDFADTDDLLG